MTSDDTSGNTRHLRVVSAKGDKLTADQQPADRDTVTNFTHFPAFERIQLAREVLINAATTSRIHMTYDEAEAWLDVVQHTPTE